MAPRPGHRHRVVSTVGAAIVTAGAALTIAGTFRGWVASGQRHRNSYDILSLIDRLGFAPDGPLELAMRAWPLVPLLVVAASVAAWWRLQITAALCGLAAGLYAGGVGFVVASRGPREGVVRVLDGPQVTATGAVVVLAGVVVIAAARATRPAPRGPASAPAAGR